MVRSSRYAPPVEFNLARPGRRNLHNLPSGVRPCSLSRTSLPPSSQSPRPGPCFLSGRYAPEKLRALTVEPGCGSDFSSELHTQVDFSGKTLRLAEETQEEFQGHTITPLGVTDAFCAHQFPLSCMAWTSSLAGSGEHAEDYTKQGLGLSPLPTRGRDNAPLIRSITHAPDQTHRRPRPIH
jgi:hypothetical protein